MKFTEGYWSIREQYNAAFASEYSSHVIRNGNLEVLAPTKHIGQRGDTLNLPTLTVTLSAPRPGIIGVTMTHFKGRKASGPDFVIETDTDSGFDATGASGVLGSSGALGVSGAPSASGPTGASGACISETADSLIFASGALEAVVSKKPNEWQIQYRQDGKVLTETSYHNMAYMKDRISENGYLVEQLALGVGESIYGLGERFTPYVKNGQIVEMWHEDGGTSSEIAYKNIPLYVSNYGYGVFVASPKDVAFEIGSEKVERVQFSIEAESLTYYIIGGPTPMNVLERYTSLTGRPALPPAWSFGLWLTTSFTTSYDEETVTHFIDGMAQRQIPLSVFHFDCFWMKGFQWCDFLWDDVTFPDPAGMLQRLKARGLRICVWINPYIAQASRLFDEGMANGYLVRMANGDVWQTDRWQAGMGLVDFTNPAACTWYQGYLEQLLDMGVDCFKTDFGERIPVKNIVWHNDADPVGMHNYYTHLYNQTVFELLEKKRGIGDAAVFARSATAGGQKFPVHWGGDCSASYPSMAETLRGGLSLAMSGFGFWSHDISGFEQTASPDVYKRWCAFGLLSSHSRLHGANSYRVPWLFDDEACEVLREFTCLKNRLMPYIYQMSVHAHEKGHPTLRPMVLAYPTDPACEMLDRQYLLGESLLVAPVFREDGQVSYYLPEGRWTHLLDGTVRDGARWFKEQYDYHSLPLFVAPNSLLVMGGEDQKPDYDYTDRFTVHIYEIDDEKTLTATIPDLTGEAAVEVTATRNGSKVVVEVKALHAGSREQEDIAKKWSTVLHQGGKSVTQEVSGGQEELG